jgi:hypothetical protein
MLVVFVKLLPMKQVREELFAHHVHDGLTSFDLSSSQTLISFVNDSLLGLNNGNIHVIVKSGVKKLKLTLLLMSSESIKAVLGNHGSVGHREVDGSHVGLHQMPVVTYELCPCLEDGSLISKSLPLLHIDH